MRDAWREATGSAHRERQGGHRVCLWLVFAAAAGGAACSVTPEDIDPSNVFGAPGTLPGTPCRAPDHPRGACDRDLGRDHLDLMCAGGVCAVACPTADDAYCRAALGPDSVCAEGDMCVRGCDAGCSLDETCWNGACLPVGGFPGGPCRRGADALAKGECDHDVRQVADADMVCRDEQCVIACAVGRDTTCEAVSEELRCSEVAGDLCVKACAADGGCKGNDFACFADEGVCLPVGSFPGGPCRVGADSVVDGACDADVRDVADADMFCRDGLCVIGCAQGGGATCLAVDGDLRCSDAAGDLCVKGCVDGGRGCEDNDFACFEDEGACLPVGSFPGGPCRVGAKALDDGACDADVRGVADADMICQDEKCVIGCAQGGDATCLAVDADLRCSEVAGDLCLKACADDGGCEEEGFACFEDEGVCLPVGSYPGGPCRVGADAAVNGACDSDVREVAAADMVCRDEQCVIGCVVGGAATCMAVDADLRCSEVAGDLCMKACVGGGCEDEGFACFEDEGVCVPVGSFPGGPCRVGAEALREGACDADVREVAEADMLCRDEQCVITCAAGGDATCMAVDGDLRCSDVAGDLCVKRCADDGSCKEEGFACFEDEGVCLPVGSYPSGPCRVGADAAVNGACDDDVREVLTADMTCRDEKCVIGCADGGAATCVAVDGDLRCSEVAGDLCVKRCGDDGGCEDEGFFCFEDEGVCLPVGSFPGGPCRVAADAELDGACDADVRDVAAADMVCRDGQCVIGCADGGDATCVAVDADLRCSEVAGDLCVNACTGARTCEDADFGCFEDEGVCLPVGSFPGGPCRVGADAVVDGPCDSNVRDVALADMICRDEKCVIGCAAGGATTCMTVDTDLRCSEVAGDLCVKACTGARSCEDEGYACLDDEGVCLPVGSFPGGPCRIGAAAVVDEACDSDVRDVAAADMVCRDGECVIGCAVGGAATCVAVDPDLRCSEVAGDVCVKGCADDGACEDADFACYADERVCLPVGSFPGGPCRVGADAVIDGACDSDVREVVLADMTCRDEQCVLGCAVGGDATCVAVDANLRCSEVAGDLCVKGCAPTGGCDDADFACFAEEGVCLPVGSFPGGPCRIGAAAIVDGACDSDLREVAAADMICRDDQCVIGCADGGDATCVAVDADLRCSEVTGDLCVKGCTPIGECDAAGFACFEDEGVCLPVGSFPGGPCRVGAAAVADGACDNDVRDVVAADMICRDAQCVIGCSVGGDATCAAVDTQLRCSEAAGELCVKACTGAGACDEGFACFADEGVCLPRGSFPGGPCRTGAGVANLGACDRDVRDVAAADMVCKDGQCVIGCEAGGDATCIAVDAQLRCSEVAGDLCVKGCDQDGGCDDLGFACFEDEGVCLPVGSFPGGPCRAGVDAVGVGACDIDVRDVPSADMVCRGGQCVIACATGGDATCKAVSASLRCSQVAGKVCVKACGAADGCAADFACFEDEGACLPLGSLPGGPCRVGADAVRYGACDVNLRGVAAADMLCRDDRCVIGCAVGGTTTCKAVDASLRCSHAAGDLCVMACTAGACADAGFACFADEGVCLPLGTFPGGPCRLGATAVRDGACDVDMGGVAAADMQCRDERCVIGCALGGDATCKAVDASLRCSHEASDICVKACTAAGGCVDAGFACFDGEGACLPTGSFPGGPCRVDAARDGACDANVRGVPDADMRCVAERCVIGCAEHGAATCAAIDASLSCSVLAGDLCLPRCAPGCDPGFACLADEDVCLPFGAFPGGPCSANGTCAQDLLGLAFVDMRCQASTCVVDCRAGGDFLCAQVGPGLACAETSGGFCARSCAVGCSSDEACFEPDGVCLPRGSFPGAPCRNGLCDSAGGAPMQCVASDGGERCLVACATGGDEVCRAIDATLGCFDAFAAGPVCLPDGTYPGSNCRRDSDPRAACDVAGGVALACVAGLCLPDCQVGGDALCDLYGASIGADLVCAASPTRRFCAGHCASDVDCTDGSCDREQAACVPYRMLTVVFTGRLTAHVWGQSPQAAYSPATLADDPTRGGFARLATVISAARLQAAARGDAVVLVDTGDFAAGTAFGLLGGLPALDHFAGLGYDAVAVGEHELGWTVAGLIAMLDAAVTRTPVVPWLTTGLVALAPLPPALTARWDPSGAVATSPTHPLRPFVVLTRNGIRIAIVGALGDRSAGRVLGLDPLAAATHLPSLQATITSVRRQADVVLLLAHAHAGAAPAYDEAETLAERLTGVDVIVAGHDDLASEAPRAVADTLIVQGPGRGEGVGVLSLAIGARGPVLAEAFLDTLPVDDAVATDSQAVTGESLAASAVDGLLAPTGLSLATPLAAFAFEALAGDALGELVADGYRAIVGQLEGTPGVALVLAVELGDGVKALHDPTGALVPTPITFADAFAMTPFGIGPDGVPGTPLLSTWVTVADLRGLLELDATLGELVDAGLRMHVAGLRVDIDPSGPPFGRVIALHLSDEDTGVCNPDDLLMRPDPTSSAPADLVHLVLAYPTTLVAARAQALTNGAIHPVFRGPDGVPLTQLLTRLVDADPSLSGLSELKSWRATASWIGALGQAFGLLPSRYSQSVRRIARCIPGSVGCTSACAP